MGLTYKEFIDNIIATRGRHGCGEEYHERHHIVPRCLGGEDKEENYIDLFGREHFEAHRLLALENPKNKKLQLAWWIISSMRNQKEIGRYICTPEEYEEARKAHSLAVSGEGNPMYGKKHSNETKQKISVSAMGRENISRRRPVFCIELGKFFWGAKAVQAELGIRQCCVTDCCRGRQHTAGGYHWRYATEEEVKTIEP